METNRLKYFSVIAETGSLTKASEILNVSHSGLSKALAGLEVETKLKLFRPQGRGLEITDEGRWFYLKAQEILRIENEIQRGLIKESKALRIGISEVLAQALAVPLSLEIDGPLSLIETDLGEIEAKLLAGEIEFGLAFVPSPKSELEYLELGEIRLNSYAHQDLIKNHEPEEIPYAVPVSDFPHNPIGYRLRDGWPADLPRRPYFAVSRFGIALELLKGARAAVFMPDYIAKQIGDAKILKVRSHKLAEMKRKIYLVKKKANEESPEMKKAAKLVRRLV